MRKRTGLGIAAAVMIGSAVLGVGSASGALLTPASSGVVITPSGQSGVPVPITIVVIVVVLVPVHICPPPPPPPPPPTGIRDKEQTVMFLKVLP